MQLSRTAQINAMKDPALRYVGGEVSVEMELPKLRWLKTHLPQTWQAAHRFFRSGGFSGLESNRARRRGIMHANV
ncbi:L-ribulokinase AraB-like protein [Escherichia coli]|uniref:L-ribulokinase AraB-like protein n=1 Tax=Escherichia coli TaxID=562 RepID=A0A377CVM4_ECOLX|nr:L-ribulokinase AraB-like protein [Escherichia coli]